MTLQVAYPYDCRSLEPRPLKAQEIWRIADIVRRNLRRAAPLPVSILTGWFGRPKRCW